ncbi:MAG TPA: hypothetical protein VM577_04645 [Anaerovoracaceae bacterium]|nr:hypothetical protein [Anaerovoracaceae bacterium]
MKLRSLKVPKIKIPKFKKSKLEQPETEQQETEKPERKKIKITKKSLLVLLLLILIALAGIGISRGVLKERAPEGKKTESVQKEQSEKKAEAPKTENLGNHLASDFIKTLRAEKYMIKYRTTTVYEGKSFEVETTYAVSGDSTAMVSADRATIIKDNKVYMLNHTDKTIISWDVDQTDNLKRIDTEGMVYLGSREEGGLVCEEYTTALSNIKLYFKGKDLVKMATGINSQDLVMDIVEVSEEVTESLFEVPSGYQTTNI